MFVREQTNRNDHPQIYAYFRTAGYAHPEKLASYLRPWCGVFVGWVLQQCGYVRKKGENLAAVATFNAMKARKLKPGEQPQPADVATYRTWSHVEFVKLWPLDPRIRIFYASGGNTTAGNPKQGVYSNIPRQKSQVRSVLRFVPLT